MIKVQNRGLVMAISLAVVMAVSSCAAWTGEQGSPTPASTQPGATLNYETITIAEVGLSFDAPANWERLDGMLAWSPSDVGQPRVGMQWKDIQPPMEMEAAMLPQNSVTLEAEPVELSWGQGRCYTIEVYAAAAQSGGKETTPQILAVESHVLIAVTTNGGRRVFDLYASARNAEELLSLQPVLERMWTSASLSH